MHFDISILFQIDEMRSKVSISEFQQLFQIIKAHLIVNKQNAHYAHPYAAVKNLI